MMDPSQALEKTVFLKPVGDCPVSKGNGRSWKSRKKNSHSLKISDHFLNFKQNIIFLFAYASLLCSESKNLSKLQMFIL